MGASCTLGATISRRLDDVRFGVDEGPTSVKTTPGAMVEGCAEVGAERTMGG